MTKERKTYTREFKIEAARLLKRSGKTQLEIEDELWIGSGRLSRWKKQFAEESEEAFRGYGRLTAWEERIRQLARDNEMLRREGDIQKSTDHLLAPKQMSVQYIDGHRDQFPISRPSTVLGIV